MFCNPTRLIATSHATHGVLQSFSEELSLLTYSLPQQLHWSAVYMEKTGDAESSFSIGIRQILLGNVVHCL
jgi:hypothetical protein